MTSLEYENCLILTKADHKLVEYQSKLPKNVVAFNIGFWSESGLFHTNTTYTVRNLLIRENISILLL